MAVRYARISTGAGLLGYPSLDRTITYRVVRDDEVAGYLWIEGQGIGDPFLNPSQRCVYGPHFEVWEDPAAPIA